MAVKKTPKKLFKTLQNYVNANGIAKTAVALDYKDVNAVRNWLFRGEIPENKRELVKGLALVTIVVRAHP